MQRYNLSVLDWKSKKDFAPYMEKFFDTYNESFSSVHNFIPLTRKEIEANIGFYLKFLVPPLNIFLVSPDNEVAGFAISLPSLSRAFQKTKGHIFPFGWYHIWKALHTYEDLDLMLNGVAPKWNGKGLSSIYHYRLNENAKKLNMRWAITNPQIDTNTAVQVWKEYETKLYTRRRCFIKTL